MEHNPNIVAMNTSIIIVTYNSASDILQCLTSLFATTGTLDEVIVYDNASSDGTQDLIRSSFPQAKLFEGSINIGFAAACNYGAQNSNSEFLAFINPDTIVESEWLLPLIEILNSDPTVGAVTPQIVFADQPEIVNTCGNQVHFSGITYCRGLGTPVSERRSVEVGAISGAAFVMRKQLFDDLGGFEDSFFMYYEDTDLSLRIRCAGLKCMAVYSAKVKHAYQPSFSSTKIFYLERNRYLALLSLMPWPILILMLPSLMFTELASWGYCIQKGKAAIFAKARSWLDLLKKRHWIINRRRQQRVCNASKGWLVGLFSSRLQVQYIKNGNNQIIVGLLENIGFILARPMLSLAHALWARNRLQTH